MTKREADKRTEGEEVKPGVVVRAADVAALDDGNNEQGKHQPP